MNEYKELDIVNCYSKKTISKTAKSAFGRANPKKLNFRISVILAEEKPYAKDFMLSCLEVTDSLEIVCVKGFYALLFRSDRLPGDCVCYTVY